MGLTEDRIKDFEQRKAKLLTLGGEKMIQKQHELGKLTARERLDIFFDKGTFQEIQLFVKHRSTLFGLEGKEINADGVVTGFGEVNGRTVFAAAQDFTSSGGSLGEMHAKKIWKAMDMAIDARKPFIALNDSGGARIQEGVPALDGYAGIFRRNTIGSGYIPQITAIMGPTAGGAVYSPALTDWVFMVKGSSYMYITGPDVIKAVIGEEVSHEDLGGAVAHGTKSGVCHFVTENDTDCIEKIKTLLSFLPDSCHSPVPVMATNDSADRECPDLDKIIPDSPTRGYDMEKIVAAVADDGFVFKPHDLWARNMLVAFIRIMGQPVGVIANNPKFDAGVLDTKASDKASRFIRFCDAFNIPLLTFADVPGYMPGTNQEWAGIISHGAKLLHAYAEATVPKITVVTRKDYGGAYIGMCSKYLGAIMSWLGRLPRSRSWGLKVPAISFTARKSTAAEDPVSRRKELVCAYEEQFNNPYFAASMGIIEEIIAPRDTRKRVIQLLKAYKDKAEVRLPKKHNNIPL